MLACAQIMDMNESPVYLLMTPTVDASRKDIPVTLLESGTLSPNVPLSVYRGIQYESAGRSRDG